MKYFPCILVFVGIFPAVNEIGHQLLSNFEAWGERRKLDILSDENIAMKDEEVLKVEERIVAFRTKMAFLHEVPSSAPSARSRRSSTTSGSPSAK